MQFTKMHGLGNDFLLIEADRLPLQCHEMAVAMCDRHFGVGADGLVFVLPSKQADFCMRIINADGSEAEQCGNAIRCVGKYVYDHHLTEKTVVTVETQAGIQTIALEVDPASRRVANVRVDMGEPVLEGRDIPTVFEGMVIHHPIEIDGQTYTFTAVSMGNPHAVIYVDRAEGFPVEELGPKIEHHPFFPRRVNVEFVTVHHPGELTMRVWERGVGQTYACGTGACAAVVSSVLNRLTSRKVLVHLKGGDLLVEWDEGDGHVYMTGPAEEVFAGLWLKGKQK